MIMVSNGEWFNVVAVWSAKSQITYLLSLADIQYIFKHQFSLYHQYPSAFGQRNF